MNIVVFGRCKVPDQFEPHMTGYERPKNFELLRMLKGFIVKKLTFILWTYS